MATRVNEAGYDNPLPGFGQYANLWRWSAGDIRTTGDQGPLPPRHRGRPIDTTDDDLYSNLMMGRGIFGPYAGALSQWAAEPRDRPELYRVYDEMDKTEYAGGVLDMFAEDITPIDEDVGRTVWIVSEDPDMVQEGMDLFTRLHTEEEVVALARDIAKYGDVFDRTVYDNTTGLKRLVPTDPQEMIRHENKEGKLEGYRQHNRKFRGNKSEDSFPWDFVHFRNRGRNRRYPYGTSLLQNAIRPWRQLVILEDWMMTYQVSKHPDRNLFILDSGTQTEQEAGDLVRRFNNKLRRYMVVDPMGASGTNATYRPNPITPLEDIVMAIRTGSNTRVEKLSGSGNATDIAPIKMCTDKFYSACRAPKGYFGYDTDPGQVNNINMKEPLTDQDVRYARSCRRVQRSMKAGYTYMHELNYKLRSGTNPEKQKFDWTEAGKQFRVEMGRSSRLEELDCLNIMQIRSTVAAALTDMSRDNAAYKAAEWTNFILSDVMQLPGTVLDQCLRSSEEMATVQAATAEIGGAPGGMYASLDPDTRKKVHEDAKGKVAARGIMHDGRLAKSDKRRLSEIVQKSPELRRLIHLGALMFKPEDDSSGLKWDNDMLPDNKTKHESRITEAQFQEMMGNEVHKWSRAGA